MRASNPFVERLAMRIDSRGTSCVCVLAVLISAAGSVRAIAQEQHPQLKPEGSYQAFYLNNSTGQQYDNDIQTALRNMLPEAKIYFVLASNALMLRGSAEDIAQAQKMLADLDRPRKTYRLTYTVGDGDSAHGGQHLVVVVSQGNRSILKEGLRVPIVTGSTGAGSEQNTQVQYQDVGLNLDATLNGNGDGLRLRTKIEQTSVADEKSNVGIQDPVIHQSVLESESPVVTGKPILLGSMELAAGRRIEVSVVAEVVK
jgi:type II secretory pathway component GspD/PulD (secretin)